MSAVEIGSLFAELVRLDYYPWHTRILPEHAESILMIGQRLQRPLIEDLIGEFFVFFLRFVVLLIDRYSLNRFKSTMV